jgi:hypothetical protein
MPCANIIAYKTNAWKDNFITVRPCLNARFYWSFARGKNTIVYKILWFWKIMVFGSNKSYTSKNYGIAKL